MSDESHDQDVVVETPELEVIPRGEILRLAGKISDDAFFSKKAPYWNHLRDVMAKVHAAATDKGWWENTAGNSANILEGRLFRTVSELVEAWEEARKPGVLPNVIYWKVDEHGQRKPEGVPIEIADAIIRLLDVAAFFGIDIADAMRIKMEFNTSRPYRHGGKQA